MWHSDGALCSWRMMRAESHCRVTLTERMKWSTFILTRGKAGLLLQLQLYQHFLSLTFPKCQASPSVSFLCFCPSDQADLSQSEAPQSHPFPGQSLIPCKRAAPVEPFTPLLIVPPHPPHRHPHNHTLGLATAKLLNLSNHEESEL